jgi:CDP-glucose 4,6-dehydratase
VLEPLTGYLLLCEKLYEEGPSFAEGWNFGPDDKDAKDVAWIVQFLCDNWGDGASSALDTHPNPHEATYLKLDCSKAKEKLGWIPIWNIETALRSIVDWNKAYLKGENMLDVCNQQMKAYLK